MFLEWIVFLGSLWSFSTCTLRFALFTWVSMYFSTKVLIGGTIFTSPSGDGTAICTWSSEPREGLAACSAKEVLSFLSHFKTRSNDGSDGTKAIGLLSRTKTLHVHHAFFVLFLCRHYTTTTWKCLISRFMDDVNKRRRIFLSLSKPLSGVPLNQLLGNSYIFDILSELE